MIPLFRYFLQYLLKCPFFNSATTCFRFWHRFLFCTFRSSFLHSSYPFLAFIFILCGTKISLASDSVYFADSIVIFIFKRTTRGMGIHHNTMLHISHRLHRYLRTLIHFSLGLMMSISSVFIFKFC